MPNGPVPKGGVGAELFYAPTGRRERWFNERNPMVLCPNEMDGIDGSLNEAQWSCAPTGRGDRGFIERSPMVLCPNGAQGDSPGQSEAPPWDPGRGNFR